MYGAPTAPPVEVFSVVKAFTERHYASAQDPRAENTIQACGVEFAVVFRSVEYPL